MPTVNTLQKFSMALAVNGPTKIDHSNGTVEYVTAPLLGIHAHGNAKEDGAIAKLAKAASIYVLSDSQRTKLLPWESLQEELLLREKKLLQTLQARKLKSNNGNGKDNGFKVTKPRFLDVLKSR